MLTIYRSSVRLSEVLQSDRRSRKPWRRSLFPLPPSFSVAIYPSGSVIDVKVDHAPGKVVFWPKDGKDVWGPDSMLEDYWVVIAQEEQVHHPYYGSSTS